MKGLTVLLAALALAACGSKGTEKGQVTDSTSVGGGGPPAPVTAPAVPPSAPTGADTNMVGHNMGSDTMTHDTMKKDSTGI